MERSNSKTVITNRSRLRLRRPPNTPRPAPSVAPATPYRDAQTLGVRPRDEQDVCPLRHALIAHTDTNQNQDPIAVMLKPVLGQIALCVETHGLVPTITTIQDCEQTAWSSLSDVANSGIVLPNVSRVAELKLPSSPVIGLSEGTVKKSLMPIKKSVQVQLKSRTANATLSDLREDKVKEEVKNDHSNIFISPTPQDQPLIAFQLAQPHRPQGLAWALTTPPPKRRTSSSFRETSAYNQGASPVYTPTACPQKRRRVV